MLGTVREFLEGDCGLQRVVFCLFGEESYRAFEQALREILPAS
jgi:O-acetyl-ADP-ribose deacetylase (regulator of RNase III)